MNIIIIDDKPDQFKLIENLLSNLPDVYHVYFQTRLNYIQKLLNQFKFEMVITDLNYYLDHEFTLNEYFTNQNLPIYKIFYSDRGEDAIKAIRMGANDFFIFPPDQLEIQKIMLRFESINRERQRMAENFEIFEYFERHKKIRFPSFKEIIIIEPQDIVFCKAKGNYTTFYLKNTREELITKNIGTVESMLPSMMFYRIDRSTLINLLFLTRINKITQTCMVNYGNDILEFSIPTKQMKELNTNDNSVIK